MPKTFNLFGVKLVRTGKLVLKHGKPRYFHSKGDAKVVRDELTAETDELYAIVLGPDHRKNQSDTPADTAKAMGF